MHSENPLYLNTEFRGSYNSLFLSAPNVSLMNTFFLSLPIPDLK